MRPFVEQHYPFAEIEAKWQARWAKEGIYRWNWNSDRKKLYCLVMFAYPSGDKLHIGHWYNYGPTDTWARFQRMRGYQIFEPIGFDAFGLPAENFAVRQGVHPAQSTRQNVDFMRTQLQRIGAMYDWDYEVDTSSPDYYKWTQWMFLLLFKRGLAYQKEALVNWCPSCQTVLANEQVTSESNCERCGAAVGKRNMRQWFFRITAYADRLLEGLERIEWPEKTRLMQRYWIGRSEGTEIHFPVEGSNEIIKVFTTRADTLFGVTYLVLAPESPLVAKLMMREHGSEVTNYVELALQASDVDRVVADRPKTGVFAGAYALHPLTNERLPIWVADYVIGSYGTGAVMAVPAHDARDFAFARQFNLPIAKVINPADIPIDDEEMEEAFTEFGIMVHTGEFSGMASQDGIEAVGRKLSEIGRGGPQTAYHLRDWTISRQRYWGAPIPIVHCPECGPVSVPLSELPVLLPETAEFAPKGKSPLGSVESFIKTRCPQCGADASRDPDTMDTFVCSSWYFMRYPDARLDTAPFDTNHLNSMLPVDQYVGGPEHAMGHLLYARFFAKIVHDAGYLQADEPFARLKHQGIILSRGGRMSKTKGNVVNPEPFLERFGSDVFRCYLMFTGDYEQGGDWSDEGIAGIERFLSRVWRLVNALVKIEVADNKEIPRDLEQVLHYTIKTVTEDTETFHFNTALSRMMELTNSLYLYVGSDLKDVRCSPDILHAASVLVMLLAPYAPHLCEELWERLGHRRSVFEESWPSFDESKASREIITIVVQINGKLRDKFEVPAGLPTEELERMALGKEKIQQALFERTLRKTVVIPDKLVNIVIE
ncbi:MAG: leucine--tRNA ligase [bacterium]